MPGGPGGRAPGVRTPGSIMNARPGAVGNAGAASRGVFGTRASKLGGPTQTTPIGNSARGGQAGVRSPRAKSGGEQLNRGVIRGAKQPGGAQNGMGALGRGQNKKVDDRDPVKSDGPEENLFDVDKQTVPGVIRGWTPPPVEQQHTAGKSVFGERLGKFRTKKNEDDW